MDKKQKWLYISVGSIVLSVLSLFLPIISYQSAQASSPAYYNIIDLFNNSKLIENVFSEYQGSFLNQMGFLQSFLLLLESNVWQSNMKVNPLLD